MKTEMTEFTSTDGFSTETWHVKVTLTPEQEAAYWKAKYERMSKRIVGIYDAASWIFAIAVVEALAIVYLLVR